ncbi:hypothetical protein [Curtobacterium sp. MCBD17_030]|uniref:hypothetical protein n=1 Tax=Curtobacterium sp. MCBD17_030 TaxID=2175649 RepID=UPI000D957E8E|nr:hypothetical protein [Curtobacterium sp. MCBD17_030]PYY32367.1 hypothetical protein DEI89_13115 [Curtobacterium sp. MCBD17_030]
MEIKQTVYAVLALFPRPAPNAASSDHESVSPVDGTTWVQRNDGWQHVDVLDREVRLRRSPFHGLMVGVDGHWAYVGDDEARMRDYLNPESDQTAPQEEITMNSNGYIAPQTEDEQSEEDREALDQYGGPTELDSHDLPDDYEIEGDRG